MCNGYRCTTVHRVDIGTLLYFSFASPIRIRHDNNNITNPERAITRVKHTLRWDQRPPTVNAVGIRIYILQGPVAISFSHFPRPADAVHLRFGRRTGVRTHTPGHYVYYYIARRNVYGPPATGWLSRGKSDDIHRECQQCYTWQCILQTFKTEHGSI